MLMINVMINVNNKIINTQADANEEAEMIIRAIMQVMLFTVVVVILCFLFLLISRMRLTILFIPKWLMIWRQHQRE